MKSNREYINYGSNSEYIYPNRLEYIYYVTIWNVFIMD